MLFHLYIAWALVYGWMSGLILLHKSFLGHFMQEITKKRALLHLLLENSFFFFRNSKLAKDVFDKMLMALEHVALL